MANEVTTIEDVQSLQNETSAISTINSNFDKLVAAIKRNLARYADSPNQMEADLDMNSNDVINCGNITSQSISANSILIGGLPVQVTNIEGLDISDYALFVLPRTAPAAAIAAALPNGSVTYLGGLPYETDSSATGVSSATYDLSVDGLKPAFSVYTKEHFGWSGSNLTTDSAILVRAAGLVPDGGIFDFGDTDFVFDNSVTPLLFTADNITLKGSATVTADDAGSNDLIQITGDYVVWDGPSVAGDGTFYTTPGDTTGLTEGTRYSLVRITGHSNEFREGTFTDPWMVGLHISGSKHIVHPSMTFIGGPSTQIATFHQAIRMSQAEHCLIDGPYFEISGAGGMSEENIFLNNGDHNILKARSEGAWDHGIYSVGCDNVIVTDSHLVADSAAIVVTSAEYSTTPITSSLITNNIVRRSSSGAGVNGIFARDSVATTITGNTVFEYPVAITCNPLTYGGSASNKIDRVIIKDNQLKAFTTTGVLFGLGSSSVGEIRQVHITGNALEGSAATTGIALDAAGNIINEIMINFNTIQSCATGIYLGRTNVAHIISNMLIDSTTNDISLYLSTNVTVSKNTFNSIVAVPLFLDLVTLSTIEGNTFARACTYAIDGTNNSDQLIIVNNRVTSASGVPFRRLQFGGHANVFNGNVTGTDPLDQIVTITSGTSFTDVSNDNFNYGGGYTSELIWSPRNQNAAAAMAKVYANIGQHIDKTSYRLDYDGTAPADLSFFVRVIN